MADFTNVEVTDTFDQWRVKTNQLGSDFIAFEAQVEEDIANIDLSDFVTISTAQTISGNKTFSGNSIFTGGVDLNGSIVTSYIAEGITTYAIELGLDKTGDMQSFIDFHATGGSDDYDARVFRSSSGVFEITQRGSGPLYLNTTDGANIELYSNTAEEAGARNNIYYDAELHIFRNKDGSDNKRVVIDDGAITADSTISAANVNITGSALSNKLTVQSGRMKLRGRDYTWPSSYSAGRYLRTDSQGNLTWEEVAGGSGSVNLSTLVFNDIVPVGTIMPWAGTSLPSDDKWKFCDGAQVSNATYPQLASLLGTKYGSASSGKTKLPNLGGKVPLGAGGGFDGVFSVGRPGGSSHSTVSISGTTGGTALTIDQIPGHHHFVASSGSNDTGQLTSTKQVEREYNYGEAGSQQPNNANFEYVLHGTTSSANVGKSSTQGGGGTHSHSFSGSTRISNYQPYVTTQYIIKVLPDDVQQVSITAGNGINVKNASNQDTTTLDLFSTSINVKVNTNHFKFNNSGLLELKTPAVSQASITSQINNATSGFATKTYVDGLFTLSGNHLTINI
jgi:microcystin-dependent protein